MTLSNLSGPLQPSSKMQKLPEVKRFIKDTPDDPHASLYLPHVTVNFKSGKPPVLIIYESEVEFERINLNTFTTTEIHELMKKKGFPKSGGNVLEEEDEEDCGGGDLGGEGECTAKPY